MGGQSQDRVRGKKKMMKRSNHQLKSNQKKLTQTRLFCGRAFDSLKDCDRCISNIARKNDPSKTELKRAHDERCQHNSKTKEKLAENEKAAKLLAAANSKPVEKFAVVPSQKDMDAFILGGVSSLKKAPPVSQPKMVPPDDQFKPVDVPEAVATQAIVSKLSAAALRQILDQRMETAKPSSTDKIPQPIQEMVSYLVESTQIKLGTSTNNMSSDVNKSKGMNFYRTHFPMGTMAFQVPKEERSVPPSPFYHSIEGTVIYLVRWEQNFPGIHLPCTSEGCHGQLIHTRYCYKKTQRSDREGTLTRIYDGTGVTKFACVMAYKCNACKKNVNGNDGELLQKLPGAVRNAYPVHPRYAQGSSFHFAKTLTTDLEMDLLTYGNAEEVSRKIYAQINAEYRQRFEDYYSLILFTKIKSRVPYPNELQWCPGLSPSGDMIRPIPYPNEVTWCPGFPPSGDMIRKLYEGAQTSNLTTSGVSEKMRHTREIQSVSCFSIVSQDHTMEPCCNYRAKDAKAIWDSSTETGEIACAVLVPTTKARDYAHAAECLVRRPNFRPKVMYTDTWPHGKAFWELLFGATLLGRLGLFHFIQRISKTLRDTHCSYRKALTDLRACIYHYHDDDEQALLEALKKGLIGKKCSDEDIAMLRLSSKWNARYGNRLRKIIRSGDVIEQNLKEWFIQYKYGHSEGKVPGRGIKDPDTGKLLFTPDTHGAVEEAKKTCHYLEDLLPLAEMYRTVGSTARSKNDLETHYSNRGESKLEVFHLLLAHFANNGMTAERCDILNLCGTARHNCRVRERIRVQGLSAEERKTILVNFQGQPRHYNHLELSMLNNLASEAGVTELSFLGLRELPADNGERFFSEYLYPQLERNTLLAARREAGLDCPENDRCQCNSCAGNSAPLPHQLSNSASCNNEHGADANIAAEAETVAPRRQVEVQRRPPVVQRRPPVVPIEPNPVATPGPNSYGPNPSLVFPQVNWPGSMPQSWWSGGGIQHAMMPQYFWPSSSGAVMPQAYGASNVVVGQALGLPKRKRRKIQAEDCCDTFVAWRKKENRMGCPPHCEHCPNRNRNRKGKSSSS